MNLHLFILSISYHSNVSKERSNALQTHYRRHAPDYGRRSSLYHMLSSGGSRFESWVDRDSSRLRPLHFFFLFSFSYSYLLFFTYYFLSEPDYSSSIQSCIMQERWIVDNCRSIMSTSFLPYVTCLLEVEDPRL
jgi:hypothetical protein